MSIATRLRNIGAAALIGVCATMGTALPARAAAPDFFQICLSWSGGLCIEGVEGDITWHNRTATVTGIVQDNGEGYATGYFEAFAGDTEIDSTTRSADDTGSLGTPRAFSFVIGDPNLRGGIDRIKIQFCNIIDGYQYCLAPDHQYKNK
jgi:hypothetical protein